MVTYDILLCLNHSITYGCPKGDVKMIYPTTTINHLRSCHCYKTWY